jgi:hypothetical protein
MCVQWFSSARTAATLSTVTMRVFLVGHTANLLSAFLQFNLL